MSADKGIWKATEVLDHGFIRLDACMADDLSVVNSARVSYGKRKEVVDDSDVGLINYLMKSGHGTPFEHNAFRLHIKAPIFVFREWQRHRISSYNEMSARYTELSNEWYVPSAGNVRTRVGKAGHYTYEPIEGNKGLDFLYALSKDCQDGYAKYQNALTAGVAPEQARFFLHVNHYSEMYWTVNCRSLMNFLNLRNADTAQWEIRQYAQVVENIVTYWMPLTIQAFHINGRIAP